MKSLILLILKDQRDNPFIKQILLTTFILIPFGLYLFFGLKNIHPLIAVLYWGLIIFFLGPHLLMLHNVCHRSPWNKKYKSFMSNILEVQGLFFGLPPSLYYHHHIKMHHKEGNGPLDLSTTEPYQRDSFLHWLLYFLKFIFLCPIQLPLYFIKRKRNDYALKVFASYIFFYGLLTLAYSVNPNGTIVIFFVPTLICWFGLMAGNWTQHAFISQENKDDPYENSITVIESVYNKRCFNDGYHIGHHLYPGMHWTEMPSEFEKNLDKYKSSNSLIFKTLDYQAIWFLLMFKKYKLLAKYYVGDNSVEGIVSTMKQRLMALPQKDLKSKRNAEVSTFG